MDVRQVLAVIPRSKVSATQRSQPTVSHQILEQQPDVQCMLSPYELLWVNYYFLLFNTIWVLFQGPSVGAARRAVWQRNRLSDKPSISPPGSLAMQPAHDHVSSCFSLASGDMPPWLCSLVLPHPLHPSASPHPLLVNPRPKPRRRHKDPYGRRDGEPERSFYRRAAH